MAQRRRDRLATAVARTWSVLGVPVLFAALTVVLTWPAAISPGTLLSLRPDAFQFSWNSWWLRTALLEHGHSPWWTQVVHFPAGVSLAAHTLSPLNAFAGALLSYGFGITDATRLLVLLHFACSAWALYALARDLGISRAAAFLAGALWSFSPLHVHYLAQLNQFTLEFLPLACLFLLRVRREGGWRNALMLAAVGGLLAASCEYYVAYAALLGLLVAAAGRLLPGTDGLAALRRLALAGLLTGVVVAGVCWPLLAALARGELQHPAPQAEPSGPDVLGAGSNDLLGFNWRVGGQEGVTLAWPSCFGYGALLLLALGGRGARRQLFWWLVFAVFLVLSLGPELRVGGSGTGVPLPYAALGRIPSAGELLRKPDRCALVAGLALAVLCGFAWDELAARLRGTVRRQLAFGAVLALLLLETSVVPLQVFPAPVPGYAATLAAMPPATAVLHLPSLGGTGLSAAFSWAQIFHGQPITDGYVVDHTLTDVQRGQAAGWRKAEAALARGDGQPLLAGMARDGLGAVVLHKLRRRLRGDLPLEGPTYWAPFLLLHRQLMEPRQADPFELVPLPPDRLAVERATLAAQLGQPVYEDDETVVFRRS